MIVVDKICIGLEFSFFCNIKILCANDALMENWTRTKIYNKGIHIYEIIKS